jgi:transposase-like protein
LQHAKIEFYPSALERYSRTDKALLLTMAEMYVQGVSTRKVDEVLSSLCGLRVSSSQVSRATAELEPQFVSWRNRPLVAVELGSSIRLTPYNVICFHDHTAHAA